jgi:hypothetical protein
MGRGASPCSTRRLCYSGAGLTLARRGNLLIRPGWKHLALSRLPPKELLRLLYKVFGTLDLDPCSPTANKRRAPVRDRVHFTLKDDGLSLHWTGTVFVNPPYGRELAHWIKKGEVGGGTPKQLSRSSRPGRTLSGGATTSPGGPMSSCSGGA